MVNVTTEVWERGERRRVYDDGGVRDTMAMCCTVTVYSTVSFYGVCAQKYSTEVWERGERQRVCDDEGLETVQYVYDLRCHGLSPSMILW